MGKCCYLYCTDEKLKAVKELIHDLTASKRQSWNANRAVWHHGARFLSRLVIPSLKPNILMTAQRVLYDLALSLTPQLSVLLPLLLAHWSPCRPRPTLPQGRSIYRPRCWECPSSLHLHSSPPQLLLTPSPTRNSLLALFLSKAVTIRHGTCFTCFSISYLLCRKCHRKGRNLCLLWSCLCLAKSSPQ